MIEVDVKVSGAKASGPSFREATQQLAGAMAKAMAVHIRERVSMRGDLAGQYAPPTDHPNVRRGTYKRTNGMWSGIATIKLGNWQAKVEFKGSSPGAPVNGQRPMVSNAEKAATVLERHGVNVLALSSDEVHSIAKVVTHTVAKSVSTQMPIAWSGGPPSGGADLANAFLQAMRARS